MNLKKSILLSLILSSILSCGSMDKEDRISRRKDFFNRFSRKELVAKSGWKMGEDKILLKKNKTFRLYSKVFVIVNSGYYSGKYEIINDTVKLKYTNNNKLPFDKLYFSTDENYSVLKCKEKTYYIEKNRLK